MPPMSTGVSGNALPCQHGIDGHGAVGALAAYAARRVSVIMAAFFCRRIVCNHGVDIAGIDKHGIARLTHGFKIMGAGEVRLA